MIASYVLLITMGTTLLATAVTSATLTCLPLCCRSAQQDMVQQNTNFDKEHHQPNEANVTSVVVNMDQLAALKVPTIEDLQERSTPPSRVGKYNIRPNHETHHDLSDCFGLKRASILSRCRLSGQQISKVLI